MEKVSDGPVFINDYPSTYVHMIGHNLRHILMTPGVRGIRIDTWIFPILRDSKLQSRPQIFTCCRL